MRNKQKLWRRAAGAAKREIVAIGKHTKGMRYGRFVKAYQMNVETLKGLPSILFQRMAIKAKVIQGDIE